jgi:hypothetical protein
MISLEQAKQLIGMPALTQIAGPLKIVKARKLSSGKILVYNKEGWCCDVEVVRNSNKQKFTFDEVEKIEGDTK